MEVNYWQLLAPGIDIALMILHAEEYQQYCDGLEDYANKLEAVGDKEYGYYKYFRELDTGFYNYYLGLPSYNECPVDTLSTRGSVYGEIGKAMRGSLSARNGRCLYLPDQALRGFARMGTMASAMLRTSVTAGEKARRDNAELVKWSAIVGAPVGVEDNMVTAAEITKALVDGATRAAAGFNSAMFDLGFRIDHFGQTKEQSTTTKGKT